METGLLHDYFGNFSHWMRLNPHEVRLKRRSENLEAQKNSNFLFGWRGSLVMIFGGVGAGGPDGDGGSGGRRCNGRE